jgi:hypothetical protein
MYLGLVHDARLYAFLAYLDLSPSAFAADLFAGNATQRTYNVFTDVFARLIDGVGLSAASMGLVAAGMLLWLSGAWHLSRRLFRAPALRLGATLAAVGAFLPYSLFHVLESFATPRLFAEAVGLHAVALAVGGRPLAGLAASLAVAALHPLMAPACLGVIVLWAARTDRRWLLTIPVGAVATAGFALAGLGPFESLGRTMDADWLAIVQARNAYIFPSLWPAAYWTALIVQGAVLAAVLLSAGAGRVAGSFYALTLAVGLIGLAANAIGADLLHDTFLIQTQLARALWLTSVAAHIAAAHGLVVVWRRAPYPLALTAGWAGWVVAAGLLSPGLNLAVAAVLVLLTRDALGPRRLLAGARGRLLAGILLVLGIGICASLLLLAGYLAIAVPEQTQRTVRSAHAVSLAVPVLAWVLLHRVRRPVPRVVVGTLAVILSLALWDQRDAWTRHVETAAPPRAVRDALPPGRAVYWPGGLEPVWFLLERPSYYDYPQGAGVLFDRAMAVSFVRHLERVAALEPRTDITYVAGYGEARIGAALLAPVAEEAVRATCDAARTLKAVVLIHDMPALRPLRWDLGTPMRIPAVPDITAPRQPLEAVYLYDCDRLRGAG